eukprot:762780-Hanusia_phi.AAC.2
MAHLSGKESQREEISPRTGKADTKKGMNIVLRHHRRKRHLRLFTERHLWKHPTGQQRHGIFPETCDAQSPRG